MQFPERPTVYLDVSLMMGNRRNTGIQRVVRNLAAIAPRVCQEFLYNCRLVQCIAGKFYRLRYDLIDTESTSFVSQLSRRGMGKKILGQAIPRFTSELTPLSMDRFITVNGTWDQPDWLNALSEITKQCHVSSVIHDLIPLTHPQFHTPELCRRFATWFARLARTTHNLVATSSTSRSEIENWLDQNIGPEVPRPRVSQFRLTSELSTTPRLRVVQNENDGHDHVRVRSSLSSFTQYAHPILLAVGTIEPRKNHKQILDACEQLWAQGWQGRLLLIGAAGWNCEEITERIRKIPSEKVLHLSNASDCELNYAYEHSDALIFASWTEGFGLPLVESLGRGLPVLASDTAIHREVASQFAEYFPLGNTDELAQRIQHYTNVGFSALQERAAHFQSVSCFDSFHSLLCDSIVAGRSFKAQIENMPPWLREQTLKHLKAA